MRFLLVNQHSRAVGGSESYLVTVAAQLERRGHPVEVAGLPGAPALAHASAQGLAVTTEPWGEERAPDVVLAQDLEGAYRAARSHPGAVRLFVCHSPIFEPQRPPVLDGVCAAIVTLNDGVRAMCESLAGETPVARLRQPVDLARFTDRGGRGERLRRALLLGNHWGGPGYRNYELCAEACGRLGAHVDLVGAGGRMSDSPELDIAGADVVIGLGRCIVEAMASGRAAYVLGDRGGDGWVTASTYDAIEARGFAGSGHAEAITAERLFEDLARFEPDMGAVNRHLAITHHNPNLHVDALVALAERVQPKPVTEGSRLDELVRLARIQRGLEERIALAESDARRLRGELETETSMREGAESARLAAEALLDLQRHRLAARLAAPLDSLRRLRSAERPPERDPAAEGGAGEAGSPGGRSG